MTKVAIIMSVYHADRLDYLKVAIESILNQEYKNFDFFIYRDGLIQDETERYIKELAGFDLRVKYIKGECNQGLAIALNCMIEQIVSDGVYSFVARMDGDDISRKNRILKQVQFLLSNSEVDVCGTSCKEFGASFALEEKHLPEEHSALLDFSITRCPFIHPSVMFRTSIFESGIRYPTHSELTEDMALWFELLKHGYKLSNINDVLLDYRIDEKTIERRRGLLKAITEVKIRLVNMVILKRITPKNTMLILSRFFFHILPPFVMRFAYKNVR